MATGLEIPVFGARAASSAVQLGASRIELNAAGSYPDGGLTPSIEDLERVAHLDVPVRIMIRPRGPPPRSAGRDFMYSDEEFEQMTTAIQRFKETGLLDEVRGDGFVFGILKEDQSRRDVSQAQDSRKGDPIFPQSSRAADLYSPRCMVDKERCMRLVQAARPLKAVFHRAFDEIVSCIEEGHDPNERQSWSIGLDDLATCGFDAILTSGGLGKAIQNIDRLEEVIVRAEGLGIEIIVGGGVRRGNVGELIQRLQLKEKTYANHVHSACLSAAGSDYVNAEEVAAILSQL
ncbi:hypothetical protein F5B20DRAFT_576379 [Whalleya microplaca]|nr:hypothetical protein F5B20DRAFT_576379 [Whalleya microplaca]